MMHGKQQRQRASQQLLTTGEMSVLLSPREHCIDFSAFHRDNTESRGSEGGVEVGGATAIAIDVTCKGFMHVHTWVSTPELEVMVSHIRVSTPDLCQWGGGGH